MLISFIKYQSAHKQGSKQAQRVGATKNPFSVGSVCMNQDVRLCKSQEKGRTFILINYSLSRLHRVQSQRDPTNNEQFLSYLFTRCEARPSVFSLSQTWFHENFENVCQRKKVLYRTGFFSARTCVK